MIFRLCIDIESSHEKLSFTCSSEFPQCWFFLFLVVGKVYGGTVRRKGWSDAVSPVRPESEPNIARMVGISQASTDLSLETNLYCYQRIFNLAHREISAISFTSILCIFHFLIPSNKLIIIVAFVITAFCS
jgi:hypothetical protein